MNGIIFLKTKRLSELKDFYLSLGCEVWLEQSDCTILKAGNLLFGFCSRENIDTGGIITFCYQKKTDVDDIYQKLSHLAETAPKDNPRYQIYHFFVRDPEMRMVEFQYFYQLPEDPE